MPGKSNAQADAVLNVLRNTAVPAQPAVYLSLLSVAPANDGAEGTEISGGGYARQLVTFGAPAASTGQTRVVANTNAIAFGPATGADWPAAVNFGIHSASSGAGNRLYGDPLAAPKTAQVGDSITFAAGTVTVTED